MAPRLRQPETTRYPAVSPAIKGSRAAVHVCFRVAEGDIPKQRPVLGMFRALVRFQTPHRAERLDLHVIACRIGFVVAVVIGVGGSRLVSEALDEQRSLPQIAAPSLLVKDTDFLWRRTLRVGSQTNIFAAYRPAWIG